MFTITNLIILILVIAIMLFSVSFLRGDTFKKGMLIDNLTSLINTPVLLIIHMLAFFGVVASLFTAYSKSVAINDIAKINSMALGGTVHPINEVAYYVLQYMTTFFTLLLSYNVQQTRFKINVLSRNEHADEIKRRSEANSWKKNGKYATHAIAIILITVCGLSLVSIGFLTSYSPLMLPMGIIFLVTSVAGYELSNAYYKHFMTEDQFNTSLLLAAAVIILYSVDTMIDYNTVIVSVKSALTTKETGLVYLKNIYEHSNGGVDFSKLIKFTKNGVVENEHYQQLMMGVYSSYYNASAFLILLMFVFDVVTGALLQSGIARLTLAAEAVNRIRTTELHKDIRLNFDGLNKNPNANRGTENPSMKTERTTRQEQEAKTSEEEKEDTII